jgi:hypothetical protein
MEWDYNRHGVAHYGMFADFIKDVRTSRPPDPAKGPMSMSSEDLVDKHLMRNSDAFWRMWVKVEAQKNNVR